MDDAPRPLGRVSAAGATRGAGTSPAGRSYGSGARILSVGLALTGIVTLGFFILAAHAVDDRVLYGRIALLWSLVFLVCSVIYRPIEQLLARTIAESRARGLERDPLRTPVLLQAGAGAAFVCIAFALRGPIQDTIFGGDALFFRVLVGAVAIYSLSYFARGWLAGRGRPELYGALVFIESSVRCLFPVAVLAGAAGGVETVAYGIVAAPLASLIVVPLALRGGVGGRRARAVSGDTDPVVVEEQIEDAVALASGSVAEPVGEHDTSLRTGAVFAASTFVVMLAEQLLIAAAVVIVAIQGGQGGLVAIAAATGTAGAIFNAFLVSRAPLQLFQAIQSTLLPHLAALGATGDRAAAARALRQTMLVIAAFAGTVALGLLALGPWAINFVFNPDWDYSRFALALIGVGMGLHLAGGTLNQSALASDRAPRAALVWALAATVFVLWVALKVIDEPVMRAATGYVVASTVLLAGLLVVERRALLTTS